MKNQLTLKQHRDLGAALRAANEAIIFIGAAGLWAKSEKGFRRRNAAYAALRELRDEMDSMVCREQQAVSDAHNIYIGHADSTPWKVS